MESKRYAKDNVLVYNAGLAKALLRKGHTIVDIAQNRNDVKRSVFYFSHDDSIYEDIREYSQKVRDAKE